MKLSIIPFILTKLKQGLGIVQDTDTATQAIAKDKYVFWKGSLKKASSAISQNDTLSASNLGDVTEGALNQISDNIQKSTYGVLLWTNSGSTMGAETVPIANLYTYDEIRVVWEDADSGSNRVTYVVPIVGTDFILLGFNISGDQDYGHSINARSRMGTFTNNGISFASGQMLYYGNVYKDWSNRAVPKKIYGIKY